MEEVTINQHGVSREVSTIHSWVPFMVETCDREERDNAVNCYALHPLCDAADPRHIINAQLAYSNFKASEV